MTKIAIITDQHIGRGQDSLILDSYFERFYRDVFFPTLAAEKVSHVLGGGDLFDRRRFINFNIYSNFQNYYKRHIAAYQYIEIVGNHNIYHNDSNALNNLRLLMGDVTQEILETTQTLEIDGYPICLIPWITKENHAHTMSQIEASRAKTALGHLDINGFQMDRGSINKHGLDRKVFKKFDKVYSGHFHHKNGDGNILYLGCPYEQTWADCDDPKGFHIFDTATEELRFIQNPFTIHKKWVYDDVNNLDGVMSVINNTGSEFEDKFVKVIVENRTQHNLFDTTMSVISKAGVHDLAVIDKVPSFVINSPVTPGIETVTELSDAVVNEDTEQIIRTYVQKTTFPAHIKSEKIMDEMDGLYREAFNLRAAV